MDIVEPKKEDKKASKKSRTGSKVDKKDGSMTPAQRTKKLQQDTEDRLRKLEDYLQERFNWLNIPKDKSPTPPKLKKSPRLVQAARKVMNAFKIKPETDDAIQDVGTINELCR